MSTPFAIERLAVALMELPAGVRHAVVRGALCFLPSCDLEASMDAGPMRALFAECWEELTGSAVPIKRLRSVLGPKATAETLRRLEGFGVADGIEALETAIVLLIDDLCRSESAEFQTPPERLSAFTSTLNGPAATASPWRPGHSSCEALLQGESDVGSR